MYYALLGHTPTLSTLELTSLGLASEPVTSNLVSLTGDPLSVADKLGGTVKLLEAVATTSPASLLSDLHSLFESDSAKNLAVTNYSHHAVTTSDLYNLKKSLTRKARFVSMETSGHELVMLAKQHVTELSIIENKGELVIAKTVWVQPGLAWAKRDRQRPYQDIKRGMLPPKLARILVNLATRGESGLVFDPFCGTGTLLAEALVLGYGVAGSDNDPRAVSGTAKNLAWVQPASTPRLEVADATHASQWLARADFIATEPYLGPLISVHTPPSESKLQGVARGLDKLYRGCLRDWTRLGVRRVAMVIPEFHLNGRVIPTLQVATIGALGYNLISQVAYSKAGATVVRNITVLERPSTNN